MTHKSGRQFFGMDVKEIRISSQDDTEGGYNLDGRIILNPGKKFHELSFVRRSEEHTSELQSR